MGSRMIIVTSYFRFQIFLLLCTISIIVNNQYINEYYIIITTGTQKQKLTANRK